MSVIQGNYVLEVRDSETDELLRMVWVDRENFMVRKVVFFSDEQRARSIRVERITLNQGLTAEEILALPRGAETVRV
jgi:outer membrane lipoprotein-sorting protein